VVKPDSLYERPIATRHRIGFYIGHLEAFDWNLFHERVLGIKRFHPEFDRLFLSYRSGRRWTSCGSSRQTGRPLAAVQE